MDPVRISLDVFPVRVRLPYGGTVEPARLVVADDKLYVFTSSPGGGRVHFERPLVHSVEGNRASGWGIQVEDGVVTAVRVAGCACGNSLRSFNPWPGRTRVLVSA